MLFYLETPRQDLGYASLVRPMPLRKGTNTAWYYYYVVCHDRLESDEHSNLLELIISLLYLERSVRLLLHCMSRGRSQLLLCTEPAVSQINNVVSNHLLYATGTQFLWNVPLNPWWADFPLDLGAFACWHQNVQQASVWFRKLIRLEGALICAKNNAKPWLQAS